MADISTPNNIELPVEKLKKINETLKSFNTEERIQKFSLRPDRADVITHAADIFLEVATHAAAKMILVPTIGLVDGIIDNLYAQDIKTRRNECREISKKRLFPDSLTRVEFRCQSYIIYFVDN